MNDEDRKILEAVKGRLKEGTEGSRRLKEFRNQLEEQTATMLTAREYARELGRIAEEVMTEFAADFVAAEDGYDAVMGALEAVSGPVSGFAAEVQQSINEKGKIRIRGIEAPFNRNKASGIAHNVSNAETEEMAQKAINGPVMTFTESAVNDTIEANAGFLQEAGMESIVTRNGGAKCCEWCEKREGSFVYGKQPRDFFQQHENCTCTITFRSEKSTRSWNGSKNRRQITLPVREDERIYGEEIERKTEKKYEDVLPEYFRRVKGDKKVIIEDGIDSEIYKREVDVANTIANIFGGEITVKKDVNKDKIKTPDYLWNGKYWDLKSLTSEKAADSAIRKGLKQIAENPGGIIIDYENRKFSLERAVEVIEKRMLRSNNKEVDIMLISNSKVIKIMRFKS